jgi:hypothetical protein
MENHIPGSIPDAIEVYIRRIKTVGIKAIGKLIEKKMFFLL